MRGDLITASSGAGARASHRTTLEPIDVTREANGVTARIDIASKDVDEAEKAGWSASDHASRELRGKAFGR